MGQPSLAPENQRELADLVHVSDILCLDFGFGGGIDGLSYRLDKSASERLGLGVGIAEKVGAQVMIAVNELDSMFSTVREGEGNGVQHSSR